MTAVAQGSADGGAALAARFAGAQWRDVVTRRTKFRLREAEDRAHILEGYIIALDNLDDFV